ncbi:NAD-binding protein [Sanghuangporus baumii]|uniref:NAD-binding protein n=1 Tax=Sanghuangporus baumii TaxID=108892 RepID=A0A9Q5HXJ3_SANBA|nr:NAD-binding protein [Sanghuangporus baumii]
MPSDTSVVLITGAAGWLPGLLAQELLTDSRTPNVHLILADIVEPKAPADAKVITVKADLTQKEAVEKLFETEFGIPDTVYALHGIMSRGSEDNFDLGLKVRSSYRDNRPEALKLIVIFDRQVNVDSIRLLLEVARHRGADVGRIIKFIFSSSTAVYGGQLPEVVTPSTIATPEGAYGTGKLVSELLINEYTRRGYIDGRIMRLPTVVVRPGPPSAATSAFLSGIIREPLHGVEAICPVGSSLDSPELDLAAWVASPETTIKNFVHAKHVSAEKFLPYTRVVYLPGFTATVREELEALREVAGPETLKLIKFEDNLTNRRIVSSWPARFDLTYPLSLGFVVDEGGMIPVVERFKEAVEAGKA